MAGLIPPEKLEQIRAASDIVEIIGSYVPLKRAGANFVALCPFHREKSPSFNVNPQRQIFHCFGCHKGGDVFTFIKDYENIGFMDAVRRLAERARIPLEFEDNPAFAQTRQLKDRLLEIHEQITQRWQTALANDAAGQIARDYLAKRGVPNDAVKLFRLGYAPDLWDDTVNWAKSKNYELAQVEQAGLIIRKEGADHHYDRFRGRLMFPICDEQGRVVAFSGRVLSGDEKTAKYVNSPETPIFTKGRILYALDKAKKAILEVGYAVVCEGQLDTIACHSKGIPNVVAPQGTALTSAQANVLRRYTDDVILCFDGDSAGDRAAARAFDDLLEANIPFRVASIPRPDDPDSFLKKYGRDAFVEIVVASKDFHEFYLRHLCGENDIATEQGRQRVLRLIAESVHKTGNPSLADHVAQRTAISLAIAPDAVRAEFRKKSHKIVQSSGAAPIEEDDQQVEKPPPPLEYWLLKLSLLDEEALRWLSQHFDLSWITHQRVREILQSCLNAELAGEWRGPASLQSQLEDQRSVELVSGILVEKRTVPDILKQTTEVSARLRGEFISRKLMELMQRASQTGISESERSALLQAQQHLRQLKRQPLA